MTLDQAVAIFTAVGGLDWISKAITGTQAVLLVVFAVSVVIYSRTRT